MSLISVAFAFSLVLPRAPYSDRKADAKKVAGGAKQSRCCYGTRLFAPIFKLKMLANLFHILPSASIQAIIEMVCFMFLHYNTEDKTRLNSIALPLFVLATFHATSFLINCCRCRKFYGNEHDDNRSKCCGSFTNILLISASTALVVVGYFADNNMLFPTWPPFLKNFGLYFSVAVALGLSSSLLSKQRKSLIITTNSEVYPFFFSEQ